MTLVYESTQKLAKLERKLEGLRTAAGVLQDEINDTQDSICRLRDKVAEEGYNRANPVLEWIASRLAGGYPIDWLKTNEQFPFSDADKMNMFSTCFSPTNIDKYTERLGTLVKSISHGSRALARATETEISQWPFARTKGSARYFILKKECPMGGPPQIHLLYIEIGLYGNPFKCHHPKNLV